MLIFILRLHGEPQHDAQHQLKTRKNSDCSPAEPPITCTNKKEIVLKMKNLIHPTARAAAHFIIRDPRLGVRAGTASVETVVHSERRLNSNNTDQSSIKKSDKQQRFSVLPAESLLLQ